MNRNLYLSMMLILASLAYSTMIHAQPAVIVYKLPKTLLHQLKVDTKQRRRGECEQQKLELFSTTFYALNNDKLLILMGLPDYFCHASSFMPITVDSQGHWEFGAVLESYPSLLLIDVTHQLWLISHWEIEAVFPLLHHSTDGVHWQEISLPKPRNIDCCFEWIKRICITDSQLELKFTGMDDTQVGYWSTSVAESLTLTPNWKKLATQQVKNDYQCQTSPLTSGDWQRKPASNNKEIWFQSASHHITVIIPRWLE